jgi:integrase
MPWPTPIADPDPTDLELAHVVMLDWPAGARHKANTALTVKAFAGWLAARATRLFEAEPGDCREWLAARVTLVAPNTQVSNWTQLKGFYAQAEGDLAEPLQGRRSPMARIPMPRIPKYVRTKAATLAEYETLLTAFDKRTTLGLRNATMVSLMFRSGMRVGELAGLDLDDVDFANEELHLAVTKNGEPRTPPIHTETMRLLRRYLLGRGDTPGPLFVNEGPRGASARLNTGAIQNMFKRTAARAGVALTPHTLRRGWLAEFMTHGGNLVDAMTIAGWTREVMPHRYLASRRTETARANFREVAARQMAAQNEGVARRRLRAIG